MRSSCQQAATGHEEHRERREHEHPGRAQVGLEDDQPGHEADDDQEGQQASAQAAHLRPTRGEPVSEVDDEPQLGELRGMEGGQPADAQPAGRAVGLDGLDERGDGGHEHEHEQADGDEHAEHREEPPVSVVEAHGHDEHEAAQQPPAELCRHGIEDAAVAGSIDAAARVHHQDAHRGQCHGGHEEQVVWLVALSLRPLHDTSGHAVAGDLARGMPAEAPRGRRDGGPEPRSAIR